MSRKRQFCGAVCLTAALLCFGLAVRTRWEYRAERSRYERVREEMLEKTEEPEAIEIASVSEGQKTGVSWNAPFVVEEEELSAKNSDYACWIYIPGTMVNYPVVWRKDDNSFYLNHGFNGEKARCGSLFADGCYAPFSEKVTVIHGHNMRDGSMFGSLKQYLNRDILQEFPYIYVCRAGVWRRFVVSDCLVRSVGELFDGLLETEREELLLVTCRGERRRLIVRAFLDEGEMQ